MKIGIICGHGAGDSGAVGLGRKEADIVRKLAPFVKNNLLNYEGVAVEILDTSKNWYDYLQSHSYNFKKFDYVIELHANAGVHDPKGNGHTTGIEVWVTPRENGISVEEAICKKIASLGFRNRGVKRANFFVINCVKDDGVSACLIENGFIEDKDDMDLLHKDMNKYASKIAEGVAEGFKLKKKKSSNVHVAEYLASDGKKYFLNVYDSDKLEKTNFHGKYTSKLTIGTEGARNCFDAYKNGKVTGKSRGTKKKGTTLLVKILK